MAGATDKKFDDDSSLDDLIAENKDLLQCFMRLFLSWFE
jgi:hypothetical protein